MPPLKTLKECLRVKQNPPGVLESRESIMTLFYDDAFRSDLRDECGVIGVTGAEDPAFMVYLGLYALQHRGQESCGIAVSKAYSRSQKTITVHKDFGLVADTFSTEVLS